MATSATGQSEIKRDPIGAFGRGMTMLLALALPFLSQLENLRISSNLPLPVVSLLALFVALSATAKIIRGEVRLKRGWGVAVVVFLMVVLSGFGIHARGGDVLLGIAQVLSALILVVSVAVHYAGERTERIAVLTAIVLSSFCAALLAVGQSLSIPGAEILSHLLGGHADSWSLLPRASGPMANGDVLAWTLAITLPFATAGVVALHGWQRDIAALIVAILWWGMLSTYSLIAPLAAIVGVLVVIASRASLKKPYAGVAIALLLSTVLALTNPVLRARWSQQPQPVDMVVRSVTTIDEQAVDDSLYFTIVNPGPMPWPRGFEIGYHILYPAVDGPDGSRLMRGGWVSRQLEQRVRSGEQIEMVLPFVGELDRGFISPDLRYGDGLLTTEKGLKYVFAFRASRQHGSRNLDVLLPIQDPVYLQAVYESIERGQSKKRLRSREEVLRDAFSLMQARPYLGLGAGATTNLLGYDARSMFIEAAVSYGWIGFALLFLILAVVNMGLLARGSLETIALSGTLLVVSIHGIAAYVHNDLSVVVASSILLGLAWTAAYGPVEESAEK